MFSVEGKNSYRVTKFLAGTFSFFAFFSLSTLELNEYPSTHQGAGHQRRYFSILLYNNYGV